MTHYKTDILKINLLNYYWTINHLYICYTFLSLMGIILRLCRIQISAKFLHMSSLQMIAQSLKGNVIIRSFQAHMFNLLWQWIIFGALIFYFHLLYICFQFLYIYKPKINHLYWKLYHLVQILYLLVVELMNFYSLN